MKIVVAIDSFKGSLTSMEAGSAAKEGILRALDLGTANVVVKPLADGGEGTTTALVEGFGGEFISVNVTGPLGVPVTAKYGIISDCDNSGAEEKTAIIEMAEAAGITLVDRSNLNPSSATTYGVGEMILDAISRGCRSMIIGIGGSATTDGGVGMLQALGCKFLKSDGTSVALGIQELDQISIIDASAMNKDLANCKFQIACDVKNPLCGKTGAVHIFGPQKGVREDQLDDFDLKMQHYARCTAEYFGEDLQNTEGAGAAGGLGFAFLNYVPNTSLEPGIDIVVRAIELEKELADASIVITGEGRLDGQTAMGKVPVGIAKLAKRYGCKVIAIAGSVTDDASNCNKDGIDAFFPILRSIISLDDAMSPDVAKKNLTLTVEQIFRLIQPFIG